MKKYIKILLFIALAVLAAIFLKTQYNKLLDRFFPLKYEGYIEKYSDEYNIDKYLVMGVICAESGFEKDAHSGVASGLMQITDSTAEWICEKLGTEYYTDIAKNPENNIRMGCFYLSYLFGIYQNTDTAVSAYNAGQGKVSEWLRDARYSHDGESLYQIPFEETKKYVTRVKILSRIYKKLY